MEHVYGYILSGMCVFPVQNFVIALFMKILPITVEIVLTGGEGKMNMIFL